jgi:hypothetical protein
MTKPNTEIQEFIFEEKKKSPAIKDSYNNRKSGKKKKESESKSDEQKYLSKLKEYEPLVENFHNEKIKAEKEEVEKMKREIARRYSGAGVGIIQYYFIKKDINLLLEAQKRLDDSIKKREIFLKNKEEKFLDSSRILYLIRRNRSAFKDKMRSKFLENSSVDKNDERQINKRGEQLKNLSSNAFYNNFGRNIFVTFVKRAVSLLRKK